MCSEIPRELVAWMEAQTSPDSEDWTIIPDGKVIVKSLPRANCRPLGCITGHPLRRSRAERHTRFAWLAHAHGQAKGIQRCIGRRPRPHS
jgi:hypothetical protein